MRRFGPYWPKISAMVEWEQWLARWELADLAPEDVPALAVEALEGGCGSKELAVLATLRRPTRSEVEEHLRPLLVSLGVHRPSRRVALKTVVDDCAKQLAYGTIEPYTGARKLWSLASQVHEDPSLFGQLSIFIGLASAWEERLNVRSAIETHMTSEARDFLARGGLDLD